jgi:general secretion pathway protein G
MKRLLLVGCVLTVSTGCSMSTPGGPELKTRSEFSQLEAAIRYFQTKFGVSHLPSRIKLSETCTYLDLDADSVRFLKEMWPRLSLEPGNRYDWNGDGKVEGDWTLEGDECLVFFLGGIPNHDRARPGPLGFSTDPRNPTAHSTSRVGPFYEFTSHRLRDVHGRGFFSYTDPWRRGQPYAYFSAYGKDNGYNRDGDTDCPALGVWPYAEAVAPSPRFLRPSSYQILCAGPDGKFGPGTDVAAHVWTSATGSGMPQPGRDDLSNFHSKPLGTPE